MGWRGVVWYGGAAEVYYAFTLRVGGASALTTSTLSGRFSGSLSATVIPDAIEDFFASQSGIVVVTQNTPLEIQGTSNPDLVSGIGQNFLINAPAVALTYTISLEVTEQGFFIDDIPRELNGTVEILIQQFNAATFELITQATDSITISTLSAVGTTVSKSATLSLP